MFEVILEQGGQPISPHIYHIHTYFEAANRASAERLRRELGLAFPGLVRVFDLVDAPIGPHPLPMFEAHVRAEHLPAVKSWLESHRGEHSVLIHPLTGNELVDHRDYSQWIGRPLKLDLEMLRLLTKQRRQ